MNERLRDTLNQLRGIELRFNRVEPDGARFVSYHFTGEPELKGQFEEATETIRLLTAI
jgi:hypothetical protein